MSMLQEFKAFAMRGNVMDMAVGIVIGAAFGKIVTSLVNDIIMPPIGWLTGGIDFSKLKWVLKPADDTDPAHKIAEVAISYGGLHQHHHHLHHHRLRDLHGDQGNEPPAEKAGSRARGSAGRCRLADRDPRFAEEKRG